MATTTVWYRTKNLAGAHGSSPTSITDETGNGQHATISGATVTTSDSTYVGKSITGTTMAVSIPTTMGGLALVDGTYVEVKGPHQATFVAANLADGDAATLWSNLATALPITIQYRVRTGAGADTFTTATYNEYTVKNGGTAANSPTAWTFQGSNNGTSWTTLHTVTGATTTANTATTHSFSNSTAYEYYKWVITANNGGTSVEWLQASPTGLSTGKQQYDGSIFIVVKRSATDSTSAWRLGTSGQQSHWTFSGTAYDDTGTTVRRSFTPSLAVTSHRIVEFRVVGTTYEAFIDNVSQLSASSVTKGWELWQPAVFVSYNGTWTEFKAIKYGSGDTPATVAGAEYTALYNEHMAAPPVTASATSAASVTATGVVGRETTASVTSAGAVSASAGDYSSTASVSSAGSVTATAALVRTATASVTSTATVTATGVLAQTPPTATARVYTPSGARVIVPLVPATAPPRIDEVQITRKSVLMAPLTGSHETHERRDCPEGDNTIVTADVGYVHLWIGGQDATYLRDKPTVIRRWESEVPFGDTAAAFEFPQLDPWDVPGVGDLDFLYPDAPVAIGIVDDEGNVRRVWSGFLDARGNGIGEGEDYAWEAKGTLWAAQHTIREPVPFTTPTDIGVLIARTLNAVISKRWADMPESPIGITTRTRGARDQTHWEYVQELLSEAWTDDGRQWTLFEASPGIFQLVLKPPPSVVDATVAYGTPGVDIDLRVDESTRVDGVFARAIAPNKGGWANIFYPALELINPPPYPNSNPTDYLNLGTSDGDTTSGTGVTDWQTRVVEIGTFSTPAVSGTMTAAWVDVVEEVQRSLGITVDGSVGPQTWNATFDRGGVGIDMSPLRLPLAVKSHIMPRLYSATGVDIGANPSYDDSVVPRFIAVDLGPDKSKTEGRKVSRNILSVYGEAEAFGTAQWVFDPNETDRTHLTHLTNVKVTGHESEDRVLMVPRKTVELNDIDETTGRVVQSGEGRPVYVVTTTLDQRARDAMAVEDLLAQKRSAQADPSRRPGNPARSSRQVADQRTPWDSESPCGVLRRTAVNGSSGLWSIITMPFAEVGKLASINLHSGQPFALAIFASLRITENDLDSIVGDPFATSDPWRSNKDALDEYGVIEAWGEQGNACGYSPGTETDGYAFTGDFILDTPVDYWTETVPYVSVAIFMRGGSGFISGRFFPAYEGA